MKPPQPPPVHFPHNSKKRLIMDPDVIEIPPPVSHKQSKQKQVVVNEVIDVDEYEDLDEVMILDETMNGKNKGKAVENTPDDYKYKQAKEGIAKLLSSVDACYAETEPYDDHNDDSEDDNDFIGDFMDYDDYGSPHAHFDNVNIPPGMQTPLTWLHDPFTDTNKIANESNSTSTEGQIQSTPADFWLPNPALVNQEHSSLGSSSYGTPLPPAWSYGPTTQSKKNLASKQSGGKYPCIPPSISKKKLVSSSISEIRKNLAAKLSAWKFSSIPPSFSKKKLVPSSSSTNLHFLNHLYAVPQPPPLGLSQFLPSGDYAPWNLNNQGGTSSSAMPTLSFISELYAHPEQAEHMSWPTSESFVNPSIHAPKYPFRNVLIPPAEGPPRDPLKVNVEDVLRKLQLFKRFDMVEDHSDHHYSSKVSSTKQPTKAWAKRIQDEWRILENDLPDSIFVRVYETRMDLLRAVIVGAEGTPYHDGLFFFDVFFPSDYPNRPPHVYYHSGGLRLNPNLYNNGKVCLSLLGTWHGNKNENWIPGVSTALQVLVSIQALILNQKPFYNEPGYEQMSGSAKGETRSQQYNENTFMLSLKTMVYTMRKPPKYFEDFVMGHFHMRAEDIVVACKAYMEGAQVGCLVKGGVQDVDEGDKSSSKSFKEILPSCVDMLVKEFAHIGVKDTEKLQTLVRGASSLTA